MICYNDPCADGRGGCGFQNEPMRRPWEPDLSGPSPRRDGMMRRDRSGPPGDGMQRRDRTGLSGDGMQRRDRTGSPEDGMMRRDRTGLPEDDMMCREDGRMAFEPGRFPVGMGYVPMQRWEQPYSMEEGIRRGTIFPSLDLPFMGWKGGSGQWTTTRGC